MSDDNYPCLHCAKEVRRRQEGLLCDNCNRWQHRTCNTGITREQYRQAAKDNGQIEWVCQDCETAVENESEPADASIVIERPFEVPEPILEESIQDEHIGEISININHNPTKEYHIIDFGSNRGKRKLVDTDGFSYTVKKQKNDHTLWRCAIRNKSVTCPATVIQDGDLYRPGLKNHVHPGEPGSHISVQIKADVKQNAKQAVYGKPTSAIVKTAMRKYADPDAPEASRPNPDYLIRAGNRIRQAERPTDPKDLDAELELDFITQKTPGFLRKDLTVGNKRHLIFYTDRQLQLLAKAKTWYMDGTFRVVNDPWEQLFSIHAFVKSGDHMKQIPLVFCIMSGKSKDDYYEVLRFIDRKLPDTDIPLQLKLVTEGKLQRYQRKKSRQVQGKVFGLWNSYVDRTISASHLLRECAFIYGPTAV